MPILRSGGCALAVATRADAISKTLRTLLAVLFHEGMILSRVQVPVALLSDLIEYGAGIHTRLRRDTSVHPGAGLPMQWSLSLAIQFRRAAHSLMVNGIYRWNWSPGRQSGSFSWLAISMPSTKPYSAACWTAVKSQSAWNSSEGWW